MSIKVDRAEPPLAAFYVRRQPWMSHALCKLQEIPIDVFYDDIENARQEAKVLAVRKARAICKVCPVRRDCAEQAMIEEGSAPGGRYGVRGCLTPSQRRRLYRTGGLRGRDPKVIPLR